MPSEVTFDDYVQNHLAVPRYKGDYIAEMTQQDMEAARAAVAALRAYGRNQSLVQDSTAPIHFQPSLGDGVRGDYNPKTNQVRAVLGRSPERTQQTLYHELLHSLQNKESYGLGAARPPASNSPATVLDLGRSFVNSDTKVPGEGSPNDFANAIERAGMYYGSGEPAAWMGASINQPMQMDPQVRRVAAQFPGMSQMYAQQTSQPNRPTPRHYKGEPEWSLSDKALNAVFGYRPEVPVQDRYEAARAMMQARLLRELNPRDRR